MKLDTPETDSPSRRTLGICLLLAVATLAAYWQAFSFEFTNYDEFFMILRNPMVNNGLTPEGIAWAMTTSWFEYWHPVTWLSHMVDCELFGLNAGWHHLVSLGFHVANTLLVFSVLQRLTGAIWRSAIVAAFFALHPLHVESVAWLAERKDVLSALFFLLTLWAYARYVEQSKVLSSKSKTWYYSALGFFAMGLMSKPMVITLPFVLLLLDYWPLGRLAIENPKAAAKSFLPLFKEKLPFFVLTVASSVISYVGVKAGGSILSADAVPWSLRLANVPISYTRYLWKMIWPVNLAVLYPMPTHWALLQVAAACLLLIIITVLVLKRARSSPYLIFGWFTFLGMLVPTIGFVQVGFQSIADRYTYIPSIGLFVAAVWAVVDFTARWNLPKTMATVTVLALGTLGFMTWYQAAVWQNSLTLWTRCTTVTPENPIAHYNLGYGLQVAGKQDQAMSEYQEALRFNPNHVNANVNLGTIYILRKQMTEATNYLAKALQLKPDSAAAHANMGLAVRELGHYQEAVRQCAEAIRLNPADTAPYLDMARALSALDKDQESISYYLESLNRNPSNLPARYYFGLELLKLGRINEAEENLGEAVRLAPNWPDARLELAIALSETGAIPEAISQYREVLRLSPDSAQALNNLSWILATHPDERVRNGIEAVRLAQQACEQTAWKQTVFIGTLSAAYAEAGQFDKAVETSRRACDLASARGETNLLTRNQELLLQYEKHRAVRQ